MSSIGTADGIGDRTLPVGEWVLAYAVWLLGLLFAGPLGDLLEGAAVFLVVIYPTLIQLPLALYYRRTPIVSPKLVYGLFVLIFVGSAGSVYLTNEAPSSVSLSILPILLLIVLLLFVYFPLVMLVTITVKLLRSLVDRVTRRISTPDTPTGSDGPGGGDRTDQPPDVPARRNSWTLWILLGLIVVPAGLGLQSGNAQLGISLASLLLTGYEIASEKQSTD